MAYFSETNSGAAVCLLARRIESWESREVQISLDFMRGERSIVTFRFCAGDTLMRDRIYASRE
jgi:hypothetical protein